jgi:hypothetical protein
MRRQGHLACRLAVSGLALAAFGATAQADQYRLQKTNSISLSSLFFGGTSPSAYGVNPISVAFDGTNAYVGGYNNSGVAGTTGVIKVSDALGAAPVLAGLTGAGATVPTAPFRSIDHLDTFQGDIILAQVTGSSGNAGTSVLRRITSGGTTVWDAPGGNVGLQPFAMAIDPRADAGTPAVSFVSQDDFNGLTRFSVKLSDGSALPGSAGLFSTAGRDIGFSPRDLSFDSQGNVAVITGRGTGYGRRAGTDNFVNNPVAGGGAGVLGAISHQPPDVNNNGNAVAILEGAGTTNFLAMSTRISGGDVLSQTNSLGLQELGADARNINIRNLDGTVTGIQQLSLDGSEDFLGAAYTSQIKGMNTGRDVNGNPVLLVVDFSGNRLDIFQVEPTWTAATGGTWSSAGNWQIGLIANGASQNARFGPSAAPQTIDLSDARTTKLLKLEGANAYTISGTGTLTLAAPTGVAANISVTGGATHTIAVPVTLGSDVNLRIDAGSTLVLSGQVNASGRGITKRGAGEARVKNLRAGAANVAEGELSLLPGGPANAGSGRVGTLAVQAGATLDLTDKGVAVSSVTPYADLLAAVTLGLNGGAWTGTGITSSTAAANANSAVGLASNTDLGLTTFMDQPVQPADSLIRYTLKGDSDLNGAVNFDDLLRLAANYNLSGTSWSKGDTNYDGLTNFDDLLALAANYNQALTGSFAGDWALAQAAVPEPTTLLAVALAPLVLRRKRR